MTKFKQLLLMLSILIIFVRKVMPQASSTMAPEAPAAVNPAVVDYLNGRIRQVLRANPERNPANLNLATVFNTKRARLEAALIGDPPQEDDDLNAEEALENFRNFMQSYNEIAGRLESAIGDLTSIEEDTNLPTEVRYEALMLLLRLRNSSSIMEAERALRLYEDFRQRLNTVQPAGPTGPVPEIPVLPPPVAPLSDEYRQYFEEILRILRNYLKHDSPKMQNYLQQLLTNPEQLKKLATALRNLTEEDEENEDYFWDLFSFW